MFESHFEKVVKNFSKKSGYTLEILSKKDVVLTSNRPLLGFKLIVGDQGTFIRVMAPLPIDHFDKLEDAPHLFSSILLFKNGTEYEGFRCKWVLVDTGDYYIYALTMYAKIDIFNQDTLASMATIAEKMILDAFGEHGGAKIKMEGGMSLWHQLGGQSYR
jgi:hypothetical protein